MKKYIVLLLTFVSAAHAVYSQEGYGVNRDTVDTSVANAQNSSVFTLSGAADVASAVLVGSGLCGFFWGSVTACAGVPQHDNLSPFGTSFLATMHKYGYHIAFTSMVMFLAVQEMKERLLMDAQSDNID